MSFWVAGAIVVSTAYSAVQAKSEQKKAKKAAEAQALEDEKRARKAEVFAETEGEGLGQLGTVSLEVDDDEIETKANNSVRI